MKKRLFISLLLIVSLFMIVGCKKEENMFTLEELAKKYNESETVKAYKEYGFDMGATVDGNKIITTMKSDEETTSATYTLSGNILSNEKLSDEDLMSAIVLIDCIGELQGYKKGELAENLNAFTDDFKKYTLEAEGFELKQAENNNSLKIDISKKIPLIDISKFYLTPSEFDMIKEFTEEKTVGNQSGIAATLAYDVVVGEDENEIYIGEKDKLTDSAYKSILSALEVMYGTEVVNKFKSVYPSFKDEKVSSDGFTIETNYKIEDEEQEESMFKDMKIVFVKINNKEVKTNK